MQIDTIKELLKLPAGWLVAKIISWCSDEVHVRIEEVVVEGQKCKVCGDMGHKGSKGCFEATIEDLALGERRTYLHIRRQRYRCQGCKSSWCLPVPWARMENRVTKRYAQEIFRLTAITTNEEAGWYLRMDDEKVYRIDKGILEDKFETRLVPTPLSKNISVDEVAWKKHHRYLTNVVDVDEKVISWNAQGRKAEVLNKYYESVGKENCQKIETVALDGARTYISSTIDYAVNAMIVLDRFHATQKVSKALDQVRRDELSKARKNENEELIELTNCKQRFILLKNKANLSDKQSATLQRLCEINQPIYKAMLMKESFVGVYDLQNEDEAIGYIYKWIDDALDSGLPAFTEIAWSMVDKIEYVLNWFKCRKSSAISEGFNNKIKRLKRMAYGYKDIDYFKLKIHQHCGYLNPRRFNLN
jgi:transposase